MTIRVRPHSSETGLIYLRARYYNPSIGRFITVDPIKDGTNWYVYCSNNPVAFVDPSGLAEGDWFESADEAAIDFAQIYNPISIKENAEYGAYIYSFVGYVEENGESVPKIFYTYFTPTKGDIDSVNVDDFVEKSSMYYKKVAIVHSHGRYDENYDGETFSNEDIKAIKNQGLDRNYLATPGGFLKLFSMEKIEVTTIAQVPFDVNSPDKSWYRFFGGVTYVQE